MDLSIIIPVYNTAQYLTECIESILNQNLNSFEIILINDGSTDESEHIIQQYVDKYPGLIKAFSQENNGLSIARNVGLDNALGKYVYFMDSDDYLSPNSLNDVLQLTMVQDLDVLFFSFMNICENNLYERYGKMTIGKKRTSANTNIICGKELFCHFLDTNEYYVNVWLQLIKKDFLTKNKIRFYDGIIYEDRLFTYLVLLKAKKTQCITSILYCKRIRESSICVSPKEYLYFYSNLITLLELYNIIDQYQDIQSSYYKHSLQLWNDMLLKLQRFIVDKKDLIPDYLTNLSDAQLAFYYEYIEVKC